VKISDEFVTEFQMNHLKILLFFQQEIGLDPEQTEGKISAAL
jgi:hypothetical protein